LSEKFEVILPRPEPVDTGPFVPPEGAGVAGPGVEGAGAGAGAPGDGTPAVEGAAKEK